MDGPEGAQARLEAFVRAQVPGQLDAIAADLDIADRTVPLGPNRPAPLPDPKVLEPSDVAKLSIDQFPCHIVTILDTPLIERVDADLADLDDDLDAPQTSTGVGYQVTYVARIFTFARGATFAETNAARYRYTLALRQAFLRHPGLASAGAAHINEATWRESYSDLDRDARRTIGASYVEFRLTQAEDLVAAETNYAGTLEVIAETMPLGLAETP